MLLDKNKNHLHSVWLTFDELKLLDKKCRPEIQTLIDKETAVNSVGLNLPFMNEAITSALKTGKLTWRFKEISDCPYCGKNRQYAKYKRNSWNHNKGEEDYSKPHYYPGVSFNEGFITMVGRGDCCQECFDKHKVMETLIDYVLSKDLKIEIQKNEYKQTKYIKDEIEICFACKKEIQKSKMGLLPALMGGEYHGQCPECGAKNIPYIGQTHEFTNKFIMILTLELQ